MTEIFMFVVVVVMVVFMSFISGIYQGKHDQCRTLQAEYYKGQCVVVQRKEIKL